MRRKEALNLGLKRYFTGKPCNEGHVAERSIYRGCVICAREDQSRYRENNPEKCRELKARCYEANKEERKEGVKRWARNNKDKVNHLSAKKRATKLQATPSWANEFFISEAYSLAQERTEKTGINWHVDHIVPLRSKKVCGLHCEFNLQVITAKQNMHKHNNTWPNMFSNVTSEIISSL